MKASYRWIQRVSPTDQSAEELARTLTFLGLNVESVTALAEVVPDGTVMAEILEVEDGGEGPPVCRIDAGDGPVTVVSRAPNARPGVFVPYVPPGSTMPDGARVESRDFGNVTSAGILCSAGELGIPGGPTEYLLEVPVANPGADAVETLGLDDWILDFDLTPNYATHCQSIVGIAREANAKLGSGLHWPTPESVEGTGGSSARVQILDSDGCPRYSAMVIEDVVVAPSPWWLQRDLLASGIRPINNIVDVTNYVMLETGQPLHAFDLDLLEEGRIEVRRATDGERLVTLDGRERILQPEDLVIADGRRPVGLAGVMGGENSEVHAGTQRILLESAHFDPVRVLKTARRLALQTDASIRFEKGADPEATVWALSRVAEILARILEAPRPGPVQDLYPNPPERRSIPFDARAINSLLGTDLDRDRIIEYLGRLGFRYREDAEAFEVPSWRSDVHMPVDLSEEVARLHGYNEIPAALPRTEVMGYVPDAQSAAERDTVEYLVAAGFHEVITRSWMPPGSLEVLGTPEDHAFRSLLPVTNPMRDDQSWLRSTLLGDILRVLREAKGVHGGARIFELGRVYVPRELPPVSLPEEPLRLAIGATGPVSPPHWARSEMPEIDYYFVKGVLEGLLDAIGVRDAHCVPTDAHFLYPGRGAALVVSGQVVGHFGELHPAVAKRSDLDETVVIGEIDFAGVVDAAEAHIAVSPAPAYPSAGRDVALVVDESITHREIVDCMREAAGPLLEEVRLFDIYRGRPIPADKKSLAYHLIYRAPDRTLTDEEVEDIQVDVLQALHDKLGAELRS